MTDLHLPLDRSAGRLAAQIAAGFRAAVRSGRLTAGTRLPSSRDLARDLDVSRGVVVTAYEQLTAEGFLIARRGDGTRIAPLARPDDEALPPDRPPAPSPARRAPARPAGAVRPVAEPARPVGLPPASAGSPPPARRCAPCRTTRSPTPTPRASPRCAPSWRPTSAGCAPRTPTPAGS
ncbi:winged helix-turn-helix domain-containing protein [Actinomadura madurae]|uniref:winged helix-turn-helix domain-containing protein n=1 Tax=Actinomadura madurae TaxID=1993 RepID=UPI0024E1EB6E|nr:winged helix-turn-helix domain-containing protein [Actinomadura madurae]